MLRGETGIDQGPLACFGVVHRKLAAGGLQRDDLCGGMIRSGFAVGGIGVWTNSGSEPDATLLVHDRIVDAGVAVPDRLVTPVRRMPVGEIQGSRRLRIAVGMLY